jgi:hypothetical protein
LVYTLDERVQHHGQESGSAWGSLFTLCQTVRKIRGLPQTTNPPFSSCTMLVIIFHSCCDPHVSRRAQSPRARYLLPLISKDSAPKIVPNGYDFFARTAVSFIGRPWWDYIWPVDTQSSSIHFSGTSVCEEIRMNG